MVEVEALPKHFCRREEREECAVGSLKEGGWWAESVDCNVAGGEEGWVRV